MSLALHVLGVCLSQQGKLEDAVRFLKESLEVRRAVFPTDKVEIAKSEQL